MRRVDAVELARFAGRLSALVPALAVGWARQRDGFSPSMAIAVDRANMAVGRLVAAVEDEVDRLYLAAFAAARARVAVASSRPPREAPETVGYSAAALVVADELAGSAGWWGRRARFVRRLAADLRATVVLCREMTEATPGGVTAHLGTSIASRWDELACRWETVADGVVEPYPRAPEPAGRRVFHDGDRVVVNTGTGNDRVSVASDPAAGQWRVVVNGHVTRFPSGSHITVRTGPGDDHVTVSAANGVTVLGGAGNDEFHGGGGDDLLSGGPGDDYLDGGGGDDVLCGGPGDDVVYGAGGADVILGVERVRADLHLLATSPVGQRMLVALRLAGHPGHAAGQPTEDAGAGRGDVLVIIEDTASSASLTALELTGGRRLSVFTVTYDPAHGVRADHSPPIIGLFHELAHIYDFAHHTAATGVHRDPHDPDRVTDRNGVLVDAPNDERAAVGLPIDHDGDPSTPHQIDPNHPYELTENALRDELGLPRRRRYGR